MSQSNLLKENPGGTIPQRWYQREALDAMHAAFKRGVTRQLVVLPTGAGKTYTSAYAVSEFKMRCVFMVHRDELARQTVRQMAQVNPSLSIGIVKADQDDVHREIIVASAQTLARPARLERLTRALGDTPLLFISDEAQHDRSESRMRIIATSRPTLLLGLTATPQRGDGLGLDAVYDEIVYQLPMRVLVEERSLARPVGLRIETELDLDDVKTRAGEFAEDQLADTVDTPARNNLIVDSWQKHASDRKRSVAFCVNVAHARNLRDAFRAAGIAAEMVEGGTPIEERQRIFAAFHDGQIQVLTNCQILTEGYDEPAIDCILMARPTKSSALYQQMCGRGLRPFKGKENCLIVDVVDATTRHKLVTMPSLAGADEAPEKRKGAALSESDREAGQLMDLFDASAHHGRIRERAAIMLDLLSESAFVWQPTMDDGQFMANVDGGWVTVMPEGDGFVPILLTPDNYQRLFERPVDAETAMNIAESRIPKNSLTRRNAPWRALPATEKQLSAAARWRVALPANVTRGAINELISQKAFAAARKRVMNARRAS